MDLIAESYGENFSFGSKSSSTIKKELYVTFDYEKSGLNAFVDIVPVNGKYFNNNGDVVGALQLSVNMFKFDSINIGNKDGKNEKTYIDSEHYYPSQYLDRLLAHEFTHAVMNANIKYATGAGGLPQFIKDGMAELTHGSDDEREKEIKNLAMNPEQLENALNLDKIYDHYPAYAGGYIFLRYIAKQFSNSSSNTDSSAGEAIFATPKGISVNNTLLKASESFKGKSIDLSNYDPTVTKVDASTLTQDVEITGNTSNNSIKGGKGADEIFGGAGKDTIYSGAGADKLYGGSGDDKLYGNAGNDTLYGGLGNNTLTGGDGKDIFVHEGGKEFIADYKAGEDTIQILSGTLQKSSLSGTNVILKTDDSEITIQNAKGQSLNIIDADGRSLTTTLGSSSSSSTIKTVTDKTKSPVTVGSAIKTINASKRTTAVKITGNKLDNTITGGSSNDTIQGGAGKDSILGNAGNDSILGNAGNDKLYGGKGNDKLYGNAGNDFIKGGAGKDSLWGGAGNDTLYGGDGVDMFTYLANGGKDYVMDYESGELFRIYNEAGTKKTSFSKSAFSDDTLTLTINGGGTVIFNDVDSSTTFNINGTSYKVNGSKLAKK